MKRICGNNYAIDSVETKWVSDVNFCGRFVLDAGGAMVSFTLSLHLVFHSINMQIGVELNALL
jgi:hypothetical protein